MKRGLIFMLLLCITMAVYATEAAYEIGSSDILEISVWGEEGLSRQVTVRSDGYISLPLIGDVYASGKTPPVLQKDIESILLKYIKDPHCAVIVIEPSSKRFFVEGQVNQPGQFLVDREMYLTHVISLAGGFTEWANRSSIIVLRYAQGKQIRLEVDYMKIVKGKLKDIPIQPGDTIIVP